MTFEKFLKQVYLTKTKIKHLKLWEIEFLVERIKELNVENGIEEIRKLNKKYDKSFNEQ